MITNKTKKNKIVSKVKLCRSLISKGLGLMFRFDLRDKGLVFVFDSEKRRQLHMFFVFMPIDVIFLDRKKKIVEIKEDFFPFHIYSPKQKAQYIIELPWMTVREKKIKIGDVISWEA